MEKQRTYFAIDLKSFYASVECIERGLDPLTTNLLVADASRTEKTICLAVSPSLKAYGISGRARLFEAIQQVKAANNERRSKAPNRKLEGSSYNDLELKANSSLALDYITATPRMALYSKYSTQIYDIYLRYFSPEDIHDYSIDEVFIDATDYIKTRKTTARELVRKVIKDVLNETGITATAGIGTNLYLCKVAMDIVAKHVAADKDGVRIAELDETSYREKLWTHRPLTDFWRVGKGYATKLEAHGMFTMGDVAKCSVGKANEYYNEELLYKLFGINAELLIDHAWGWEPCRISDIKAYKPSTNSISSGQVLHCPYDAMHIPTDCPHREKNGWTADAFLSSYQTVYNFDVKAAYLKWLDDIVDTQRESGQICCIAPTSGWGYNWGSGVTWDAALFIVPWNVYSFTGDLSVLSRYAQPMKKYLSYLDGVSDDDIYTIGLGDWCPPDCMPVMQTSALLTCYAKKVYDIYANVCARLGNESEAARAKVRSAEIRAAFQKRFLGSHEAAQTYFASLVWFDMTDDKQEAAARLAEMVKRDDGRVIGGIFGAQMIPEVLRDYGYFSLAWEAIQKDGYPSWLYMLSDGSGTLWEHWDGKDSRNHHMFSTVDAFIHASLTGLRAESWSDDRKTLRLKPYFPNDIHRFSAEYEFSCGKIVIAWNDETFRVVLPNGLQGVVEYNGTEHVLQSGENVLQRKK